MQLLNNGNPEILSILGAPENLPVIREAIGLTDFYIPGEDEVEAEYDEIRQLLNSEPYEIPTPPEQIMQGMQTGQQVPETQQYPSIEIDPIYDNNALRFEIIRKWVNSEEGRQAKTDNQKGYKNVLLHGQQHYQMKMQQEMQQAMQEAQGAAPNAKPNPKDKEAPIEGESDVNQATGIM
jgi:hypothetical protein